MTLLISTVAVIQLAYIQVKHCVHFDAYGFIYGLHKHVMMTLHFDCQYYIFVANTLLGNMVL